MKGVCPCWLRNMTQFPTRFVKERSIHYFGLLIFLSPTANLSGCWPGWRRVRGGCFRLYFDTYKTWRDAEAACEYLGASLAAVRDKSILEGLQQLVAEYGQSRTPIFVGARGRLRGDWRWLDNSRVTSDAWSPGKPSGDGQCGAISYSKDWALSNVLCSAKLGFICQTPPGK